MILRLRSIGRAPASRLHVANPWSIPLAILLAVVAAAGWLSGPLGLAIAIAVELGVGGLGAVALIGPAKPGLGLARYTTLAIAGVAATLVGRLVPGGASLLGVPPLAVLLWGALVLEIRGEPVALERTLLDLVLTAVVFAMAAGVDAVFGNNGWPPPMLLVVLAAFLAALRSAELRGRGGVHAVGQSLLHALAIGQVALALDLLALPGLVGPAILALAFYAWGGAAEALDRGASARAVVVEFGSLAVLGLLVALLMYRP
jgi:hypothetical protein